MEKYGLHEAQFGVFFDNAQWMRINIDSAYCIEVSKKGGVCVRDREGHEIARLEETNRSFGRVQLSYSQPILSISFQVWEEIDYYPHCDGEYDRYEHKWVAKYHVKFDENTKQLNVIE